MQSELISVNESNCLNSLNDLNNETLDDNKNVV